LKNILDRHAEAAEKPGLSFPLDELNGLCEYRDGLGSATHELPERLDAEIANLGYETKVSIGTTFEQLDTIIQSDATSLPLTELAADYFETVEGYDVQPGRDGWNLNHIVIPFGVNDETVLFYDPMEGFFRPNSSDSTPSSERPKAQFYEWWSDPRKRWTFWIEESEQQQLDTFGTEDNGNE